jgi:hypothetical protein
MDETNVDTIISESLAPEPPATAPGEGDISDALVGTEKKESANAETGDGSTEGKTGRTIKYKGKDVSLDDDRFIGYAQKGFDYNQKMHDFRVEKKLFEQERARNKEKFEQLAEIDAYAKANPQWLKTVQDQWALIQSGQQPAMTPETELQVLRSQLTQLQETMSEQKQSLEDRRVAELQATQEGSIQKYKDAHPEMDWASKDAEGNSLEDRIGHAMLEKGVRDFSIMADSFLLKEHLNRKLMEGKESAAKSIQKANQMGLGKVTKQPGMGKLRTEYDIKGKTYDQIAADALKEYGIA